jgi:hypothetical protein
MGMMKYQDDDGAPRAAKDTLPHQPARCSYRYSPRRRAVIWILAFVVSWLLALGLIKLIIMVIGLFRKTLLMP